MHKHHVSSKFFKYIAYFDFKLYLLPTHLCAHFHFHCHSFHYYLHLKSFSIHFSRLISTEIYKIIPFELLTHGLSRGDKYFWHVRTNRQFPMKAWICEVFCFKIYCRWLFHNISEDWNGFWRPLSSSFQFNRHTFIIAFLKIEKTNQWRAAIFQD